MVICGMIWYGMVRCGIVRYDVICYGLVWYYVVWYGIVTRVRGGRWGSHQGGVERRERGKLGVVGEVRIVQIGKIVKMNNIASRAVPRQKVRL